MESTCFNKGDKIIWDSHFGYELGYFVGTGSGYYTFEVDLVTGCSQGLVSFTETEIHQFTDENHAKMIKKYKQTKNFHE